MYRLMGQMSQVNLVEPRNYSRNAGRNVMLRKRIQYRSLARLRLTNKHDLLSIQTRFRQSVTVIGTHLAFEYWVGQTHYGPFMTNIGFRPTRFRGFGLLPKVHTAVTLYAVSSE